MQMFFTSFSIESAIISQTSVVKVGVESNPRSHCMTYNMVYEEDSGEKNEWTEFSPTETSEFSWRAVSRIARIVLEYGPASFERIKVEYFMDK